MKGTELRDTIAQLLEPELGTYTLKNGESVPAIVLIPAGDPLPNYSRKAGLECIILAAPPSRNPTPFLGEGMQRSVTWQLYLIQRTGEEGSYTIDRALEKLELKFTGVRSNAVTVERNKEIREQFSVRIPDFTEVLYE